MAGYAQGMGIDEPLAMQRSGYRGYYNADGLGSITLLTGSDAKPIASYVYDSFGNTTPTEGLFNPFRYTGREQDPETGLYYYRARYYDQNGGRFVSEDPLRFTAGINFYRYVENDPVDSTDPSGLATYQCTKELHAVGHPTKSGRKSFTDADWNPAFHEYLCVVGPDGVPVCGGQDHQPGGNPFWKSVPSKPSDDHFDPKRCDKIQDDSCYDECVLKFITPPIRPPYGIDSPIRTTGGMQCKEWVRMVERHCEKKCYYSDPHDIPLFPNIFPF